MSDPSVVVERAPDGWTHIGGPGMHLLVALDEDDERTVAASDAADGGDVDDVVEVLTAGGMRKAPPFVGVHWKLRTRIVAFGPVSARVTLADGSEHDVRATSARVWTDLELPEHPERVVLRVLEESERPQPVPPQLLVAGLPASGHEAGDAPVEPIAAPEAGPAPSDSIPTFVGSTSAGAAEPAGEPGAASGGSGRSGGSAWGRSWSTSTPLSPAPAADTNGPSTESAPDADGSAHAVPSASVVQQSAGTQGDAGTPVAPGPAPGPALRPWASAAPAIPVRGVTTPVPSAAAPVPIAAAPVPIAAAPAADDLPVTAPRDVHTTWAARPVPEPEHERASPSAPQPSSLPARPAAVAPTADDGPDGSDGSHDSDEHGDEAAAPPSYDYLFGHTTAADEHRKVLAQLTRSDDEDSTQDEDDHRPGDALPAVADLADAPVTNPAPAPGVPAGPLPSAPEGGLISSVPWARPSASSSAATSAQGSQPAEPGPAEPEHAVPTFSGRHTPPPAPSLLSPMNMPPGLPAPRATPLASTGPLLASTGPAPASTGPAPAAPGPAPAAPGTATPHPAYARPGEPAVEPTFVVPLSMPVPATSPAVPPSPAVVDAATDGDDDEAELTVDRSALLEAHNAAQQQTFSGPSVLAVLCSVGHPTPPHGDRCRVCGSAIPPQEPFSTPRPPLGVLRLSTGDVVTLDRSVLLGRAPQPDDGLAAHDRPHVVKVPSPERDVSRNHVEVILEGWHVLIRDLGTTNGTTVTLPGDGPMRLRANDQQVLEPGSFVSMADEVSFTFEAAP